MNGLGSQAIAWMRSHHSTISTAALSAFGITLEQRKELVRAGVLTRVLDGAYVFNGTELTELGRCAAVCTSRPELVIAGPTAARIHVLRRAPRDDLIYVLAPPHSQPCREPWIRPYRTPLIFDDEIIVRPDGIRVTDPKRTTVDMTRYLKRDALLSMAEDGLAKSHYELADLQFTAARMDSPGRPWVRRFLKTLGLRAPGKPVESDPELRVLEALRHRGVHGLVKQHRIVLPGYGTARFDLAIPPLRWALEVDVHPEHRTIEGDAKDNVRDDAAERIDWFVKRVSEGELRQFDAAIDRIVESLERRRRALKLR